MDYRTQAQAILDKRTNLVEQRRALTDSIQGEATAEQRAQLERMDADISSFYDEARSIVEEGEREHQAAELRSRAGALVQGGAPAGQLRNPNVRSLNDEIRALTLPGQVVNITPDQVIDARNAARVGAEYRTAVTTNAANAGATVPTTFVAKVLENALPEIGVWQAGPEIFTTSGGESMVFPRLTGRPSVGAVAENSPFPTTDAAFNQFSMGAHKYGAIVQVSKEMVQDSLIDIAGYVAGQAGQMLGRQIANDLINGAGTNTPTGFLTLTTAGATAGTAGTISGDDCIALYHSVIKPYRQNGKWMMNDLTVGQLRGVKDQYGQYLWQPGLVLGEPDVLLGKPVISDTNMPTNATGAKFVAFGDFSKYFVRQVNGIQVELSFEYGWGSDLVSYKVTWRGDGNLSDTTGAIKHLLGK